MNSNLNFNQVFFYLTIIISLITILFFIKYSEFLPLDPFSDIYYHLTNSSWYLNLQKLTFYNIWESLPWGHPQTYPPFYHVLIAPLIKFLNYSLLTDKVVIIFTLLLSSFLFCLGIYLIFKSFLLTILTFLFSFTHLYFLQIHSMTLPALLVYSLTPLMFFFWRNKKYISFIILSIFLLYTHRYLPYFIFLSFIVWNFVYQKESILKNILLIEIAFLFYLPYLIENLKYGWHYFPYLTNPHLISSNKNFYFFLPFDLLTILSLILPEHQNSSKRSFNYFFILFLTLIPIWLFIPSRSTLASSRILILSPLAADGFLKLFTYQKSIAFFIWVLALTFNFQISTNFKNIKVNIQPSFLNISWQNKLENNQLTKFKNDIYFIAQIIKEKSDPFQPFYFQTQNFYLFKIEKRLERVPANIISFFSQRPYLQRGVPEVFFYPEPDYNLAKIIISDQKLDQPHLIFINQVKTNYQNFYIYLNKNYQPLKSLPIKSFLNLKIAQALLVLGLAIIIIENFYSSNLSKIKFNLLR